MQTGSDCLDRVTESARLAEAKGVYLLFSHAARFCDPLVTEERARLVELDLGERVAGMAQKIAENGRGPAVYFPLPLVRAMRDGASWETAAAKYHYDMIVVDERQGWSWRGQPVARRTKDFFLEHLAWQPEVGRYYFEYRVHDAWWDKSYLDVKMSPLTALRFEVIASGVDGEVKAHLLSGQTPSVLLNSFRLDGDERLFVTTEGLGEVLVAETERFRILRGADDSLEQVDFAGASRPLEWPSAD